LTVAWAGVRLCPNLVLTIARFVVYWACKLYPKWYSFQRGDLNPNIEIDTKERLSRQAMGARRVSTAYIISWSLRERKGKMEILREFYLKSLGD
jgi:hypothetical protein